MSLRLIKLRLPDLYTDEALGLAEESEAIDSWLDPVGNHSIELTLLVFSEQAETVVEAIDRQFSPHGDYRTMLLPVEASIPRPDRDEEEAKSDDEPTDENETPEADEEPDRSPPINIEELYGDVTDGMAISPVFTVLIVVSTLVAAIGIVRDDTAMVIAAMIIAPLLNPNIALALSSTLGDTELTLRSVKVGAYGLVVTVGVAALFGLLFPVDPTVSQIENRTAIGVLEFLLAGSSGAAGALAFTSRTPGRVVGVMIAVALLPPAVIFGMLLGEGLYVKAVGALLLVASNLICVNLFGMLAFFVQNIRPRTAWESKRAKKAFRTALVIWIGLLVTLAAIIYYAEPFRRFP